MVVHDHTCGHWHARGAQANQTFFPRVILGLCCVGSDDKMSCKSASIYTSAKLLLTAISCFNDRPWFECVKQESRWNRSFTISHNQIIISGCCKKFAVTSLPVTGEHMLQIICNLSRLSEAGKKPPCLYKMRLWQAKYVESMPTSMRRRS